MIKHILLALGSLAVLFGCTKTELPARRCVSIAVVENHVGPDGSFKGIIVSPQYIGETPKIVTGKCVRLSGDLASVKVETVDGGRVDTEDSEIVRLKTDGTGATIVFAPGAQTDHITCWIKGA